MNNLQNKVKFDSGALGILMLLLVSQLFFDNGIYIFLGGVCFWVIFSNLQQSYKPSVFTIVLIYHMIQIMAGVWLSNYMEKELDFRSEHTGSATIFAYIGMLALFTPIIYFQNKIPSLSFQKFKAYGDKISIERTFNAYLVAFFSMNALGGVAFVVPGLAQVIFSVVNIKWFFFILFGFQVVLKRKMIAQFALFGSLEFVLGFFSFFSDFKTVLFFLFFIALVFLVKVNFKQIIVVLISVYALFYIGVIWTSIKGEYRSFLNHGSKSQAVYVDRNQALTKLVDLSQASIEGNSFNESAVEFMQRLQYTYHLAKTMDRVPSVLPYEDGGNIAGILKYVTTPRIINPDKPAYAATVKTVKYTNVAYAGASTGTSFSLGYFADCYIDFGYWGMWFPLLVLGIIYGGTYFYFVRRSSPNFVFNYAVVGAMFMEFNAFETDGTYLMGRLFATLVTFYVVKQFFFPWLYNYLKMPEKQKVSTPEPAILALNSKG